jgi:hypothetical protein
MQLHKTGLSLHHQTLTLIEFTVCGTKLTFGLATRTGKNGSKGDTRRLLALLRFGPYKPPFQNVCDIGA